MSSPITTLLQQKNKFRFLVGYFLWKTGLCRYVRFNAYGVTYRYFPSALSRMIYANRDYVKAEYETLKSLLAAGDVFIDVGANIGTWSLMASRMVGPGGRVLSFEPHPRTFGFLQHNIGLNRSLNIEAHNIGLSDKPGTLFLTDAEDDTNHLTTDGSQGISIPVKTLDQLTQAIPHIKLLKIDVEGYELFVLKGALQTLRKCKYVVFESEPSFQRAAGYEGKDILTLLHANGFRIYRSETNEEIGLDYTSPYCENLLALNPSLPHSPAPSIPHLDPDQP